MFQPSDLRARYRLPLGVIFVIAQWGGTASPPSVIVGDDHDVFVISVTGDDDPPVLVTVDGQPLISIVRDDDPPVSVVGDGSPPVLAFW